MKQDWLYKILISKIQINYTEVDDRPESIRVDAEQAHSAIITHLVKIYDDFYGKNQRYPTVAEYIELIKDLGEIRG